MGNIIVGEPAGNCVVADLHTHSTASDGQHAPAELVRMAKAAGLAVMALTDHDTTDGLAGAMAEGRAVGLPVVAGIEISAREHRKLHILGYGFDPEAAPLKSLCGEMRRSRDERKHVLLERLAGAGMKLDLAEVEAYAGGGIVGKPHFARAMVARGYVPDVKSAFDLYLDGEACAGVGRYKPDAETCIRTIRSAGGLASLAHPCQLGMDDGELDRLVSRLAGYGLNAIECFYPAHTPVQTGTYTYMARRYGLRVTGGSDFHGENVKPGVGFAKWGLDVDWLMARYGRRDG